VGTATTRAATITVKPVAPRVSVQPRPTTARAGTVASFTVRVTGFPAPKVQWYERRAGSTTWVKLTGSTSAQLQVLATKARDGALYRAVATNAAGSVTSTAVRLTVR